MWDEKKNLGVDLSFFAESEKGGEESESNA